MIMIGRVVEERLWKVERLPAMCLSGWRTSLLGWFMEQYVVAARDDELSRGSSLASPKPIPVQTF